ncbi:MAG TPA: 23S rRNA (adenine(2030)-N(6))-methyltransferase RlmJ, partial [Opitutaceae bacterium]
TERARVEEFFARVRELEPPPALACELEIAGQFAPIKLKGCGLLVINPPWRFDEETLPVLAYLAEKLQQEPGAHGRVEWVVSER